MLNYYRPIQTIEGYTLSIDKMTIDYRMDNLDSVTALGRTLQPAILHKNNCCFSLFYAQIKLYESKTDGIKKAWRTFGARQA